MFYARSLEIAELGGYPLRLVETGTHSTQTLAGQLGVFVPTASHDSWLCQRGYSFRSVKCGLRWDDHLEDSRTDQQQEAFYA
ncbi:hypothetical protein E3A20_19790 [Planctomyces bekefii]|uniref:Uncharacterized protein n=1 Tax=Planctomyces bekefii TaxID=1653850 RepID=A0A5C6M4F6_9PLAN|nr:hypothetical protein E3A20_19790 [Planctomyces bekefii]